MKTNKKVTHIITSSLCCMTIAISLTACTDYPDTAAYPTTSTSGTVTQDSSSTTTTTTAPAPAPAPTSYNYAEHMGTWYYTPCTDYTREDISAIRIGDNGNNNATIYWEDGSSTPITFVSDNVAHSASAATTDAYGKARSIRTVFTFSTVNGAKTFEVLPRYTDNNDVAGQSTCAYRSADDFFFDTPAAPAPPSTTGTSTAKTTFLNEVDDIRTYSEQHLDTAKNQHEMNTESYNVYKKWDDLLNDVYQHLKATMPADEFKQLEADEAKWIKTKEAAMEDAAQEMKGGSGEAACRNGAGITYTEERCLYLISLVK